MWRDESVGVLDQNAGLVFGVVLVVLEHLGRGVVAEVLAEESQDPGLVDLRIVEESAGLLRNSFVGIEGTGGSRGEQLRIGAFVGESVSQSERDLSWSESDAALRVGLARADFHPEHCLWQQQHGSE